MRKTKNLPSHLRWLSNPIQTCLPLVCLVLSACTPTPAKLAAPATSPPAVTASQNLAPTVTRQFSTPTQLTLPAEPTATESRLLICPPLPSYSFAELEAIISNPFNPPPPGSDDPHQGVDLAVQENGLALAGGEVQAILSGVLAARLADRFPYGTALLIETPLDGFSPAHLEQLAIPAPAPTLSPHPVLTCPALNKSLFPLSQQRSLYILYAHLQEASDVQPGEAIRCGQLIGRIGQSGNALNPHLHVEARVGPAGTRFSSLAHYTSSASAEEMSNYCLWRVSGVYQLVDPLQLLEKIP
jgi:murein DD-endopeptidase MepM/ murein hydrolase activator NlpD